MAAGARRGGTGALAGRGQAGKPRLAGALGRPSCARKVPGASQQYSHALSLSRLAVPQVGDGILDAILVAIQVITQNQLEMDYLRKAKEAGAGPGR